VLIVFLHYIACLIMVPTLHDLVHSQTWQYQGQIEKMPTLHDLIHSQTWQYQGKKEKMLVPMVFSC